MLAGHPPFVGFTAQQLLACHAMDPVPPLRTVRATVPEGVEQTVLRALAKVPADRFRTAAEFAQALAAPRETAVLSPSRPPLHGRRRTVALAAAGLGLALAGYLWRPEPRATLDPNLVAIVPFRVNGAVPALGYLREGVVDLVAARLTGEGGARAADPNSVMAAWRQAAGSEADDLPERVVLWLARRLGAGQLLLGGVVGTPDHLALSASLLPVRGGGPRADARSRAPRTASRSWWIG